MIRVIPSDDGFLCVDTEQHRIIGRHATRTQAEKQRRYFRMMKARKGKRRATN